MLLIEAKRYINFDLILIHIQVHRQGKSFQGIMAHNRKGSKFEQANLSKEKGEKRRQTLSTLQHNNHHHSSFSFKLANNLTIIA